MLGLLPPPSGLVVVTEPSLGRIKEPDHIQLDSDSRKKKWRVCSNFGKIFSILHWRISTRTKQVASRSEGWRQITLAIWLYINISGPLSSISILARLKGEVVNQAWVFEVGVRMSIARAINKPSAYQM